MIDERQYAGEYAIWLEITHKKDKTLFEISMDEKDNYVPEFLVNGYTYVSFKDYAYHNRFSVVKKWTF